MVVVHWGCLASPVAVALLRIWDVIAHLEALGVAMDVMRSGCAGVWLYHCLIAAFAALSRRAILAVVCGVLLKAMVAMECEYRV